MISKDLLRRTGTGLTVLLLCLGAAYLAKGTKYLFGTAYDLQLRWMEEHYVFQGQNPLDIIERRIAEKQGRLAPQNNRDSSIDPDIGEPLGGYPPWAYVTGALFTWPSSFEFARVYYGLINLALLAVLLAWGYRLGRSQGREPGLLFAASLFAISSICTTLGLGQYGLVVLCALVVAVCLDERDRWILSGLLMGVALTKVTLAAPFMLPFLIKRRWKTISVALSYITVSSLFVWGVVRVNPIEMLRQMTAAAEGYVQNGYSLIDLLTRYGMETGYAIKLAALLTLGVAMLLFFFWRSAPMLTHFAIGAVVARMWTYHVHSDNLILAFLMIALGLQGLRNRRWLGWAGFVLMGLSLWPPARFCDVTAYRTFQCAAWLACLALLLFLEWHGLRSGLLKAESDDSTAKPS